MRFIDHHPPCHRLGRLLDENAVLARELASAQQRSACVAAELGRTIEQLQAQALQLRAELVKRDTVIALLREELGQLEPPPPGTQPASSLC